MKNNLTLTVLSFMLICSISHGQNVFPATGNVGIGTLSPNYNLDIQGSISATQIFVDGNPVQSSPWTLNGTTTFFNSGKVGIGTSDPDHTLDVAGTLNATAIFLNGTPIDNSASPWTVTGTSTYYLAGNVGIGTGSPNTSYALDVAGPINASEIYLNGSPINNAPSPWAALDNDLFYATGNIGIGTDNTQGYKLAVAGNVIAEAVKVELQGAWPDFVFEADYRLASLSETEAFIKAHGHLPQVPSAEEVKSQGIQLGEMDAILLQKIEELTLYTIQQQKEIEHLNAINDQLIEKSKVIESLTERLEKLEHGTMEK